MALTLSLAPDILAEAQEIFTPHRIICKDNTTTQNLLHFVNPRSTNIPTASVFAISINNQPTGDLIISDSVGPYH